VGEEKRTLESGRKEKEIKKYMYIAILKQHPCGQEKKMRRKTQDCSMCGEVE
jgi:hypothetical protein